MDEPALSILLTGIDRADDDGAIARTISRSGEADLPLTVGNIHRVRNSPRPLTVIVYETAQARHDPVISFAFTSTAQVYFQQFGSEGAPSLENLPPFPGS